MLTKNKANNIKRLEYLAREIAKTKPDKQVGGRPRFYFGSYADFDIWDGKNQKLSCGTSGCGIGLASTLPRFRRLGLRLRKVAYPLWTVQPYVKGGPNENTDYDSWEDVAEILGLTSEEYTSLFIPDSAPLYLGEDASPKDVADNIREFCKAAKKNSENSWILNGN